MISSPRSSLIYLSDAIHRSDPDILHLDENLHDEDWNDSRHEELSSSSIRPPYVKNAFQIHKKRTLSRPVNGGDVWVPLEGRPEEERGFHPSARPKFFVDPFPSPPPLMAQKRKRREKGVNKNRSNNRLPPPPPTTSHEFTQSFQSLASEEASYITKSLPLIPQSARKVQYSKSPRPSHEFPSSKDSLLSNPQNHFSKDSELAESITDFWAVQTLKSKEKLRRKKDGYRSAFTVGLVTVVVTLCLTFLVLYWNYSETLHRRRTKKEGLILDHWGKKAPSKEEMHKLIEENSLPSDISAAASTLPTSQQSTTPKISRRDNSVVYIDT